MPPTLYLDRRSRASSSAGPSVNAVDWEETPLIGNHRRGSSSSSIGGHGGHGHSHGGDSDVDDDGHHHHHSHLEKHLHGSTIAAVALLVALCIHSILAGYEIGTVTTHKEVMSVFIALIAHK